MLRIFQVINRFFCLKNIVKLLFLNYSKKYYFKIHFQAENLNSKLICYEGGIQLAFKKFTFFFFGLV